MNYGNAHVDVIVRDAVAAERERCAKLAENEPEPDGKMPPECADFSLEQNIRAAVRATKKSIARAIRNEG